MILWSEIVKQKYKAGVGKWWHLQNKVLNHERKGVNGNFGQEGAVKKWESCLKEWLSSKEWGNEECLCVFVWWMNRFWQQPLQSCQPPHLLPHHSLGPHSRLLWPVLYCVYLFKFESIACCTQALLRR